MQFTITLMLAETSLFLLSVQSTLHENLSAQRPADWRELAPTEPLEKSLNASQMLLSAVFNESFSIEM